MNIVLRVLNDVCCSNCNAKSSKPGFPLSVTQSTIVSHTVDRFFLWHEAITGGKIRELVYK